MIVYVKVAISMEDDCHADQAGRLVDLGLSQVPSDSLYSWQVPSNVVVEAAES